MKLTTTLLLIGLTAGVSNAAPIVYTAQLSGAAEAPANNSPGVGTVIVTIDEVLSTMRVQASFSGLLGTTIAAHIHAATPTPLTGTAGVATQTPSFPDFPNFVTSGSYDRTFDMTLASSFNLTYITANGGTTTSAFTALTGAMAEGRAYFNLHTTTFSAGEIRGFLIVPEPGALSLLAGAGVLLMRRRG